VIASEMEVDGATIERSAGRPFSVPWPRGEVQTGSVPVGESVRLGDVSLRVDRVELKSDRVILVWGQEEPEGDAGAVEVLVEVSADGRVLAAVPGAPGSEPKPGEHRSVHYPAPYRATALEFIFVSAGGERSEPVRAPIR